MPVVTKRQVNPTLNANSPTVIPQITIDGDVPSVVHSTKTEIAPRPIEHVCYDCNIPFIYSPVLTLFNFLWVFLIIILAVVVFIVILNVTFFSFMGLILFVLPKKQRCKNCGKLFKFSSNNKDTCPYCGMKIENDIKPH